MSRPLRILEPNAYYHVMNRGLEKRNIFQDPTDYHRFISNFSDLHTMFGVIVYAYCLMPNHYHLLLFTPQPNLPRILASLNSQYAQAFNRKYQRVGPLFQGRYRASLIQDDAYLKEVTRYIHNNPVKAGLCNSTGAYEWSSFNLFKKLFRSDRSQRPSWLGTQIADQMKKTWEDFHNKSTDNEDLNMHRIPTLINSDSPTGDPIRSEAKLNDSNLVYTMSTHDYRLRRQIIENLIKEIPLPQNQRRALVIWAYRKFLGWTLGDLCEEFEYECIETISRLVTRVTNGSNYLPYRHAITTSILENHGIKT